MLRPSFPPRVLRFGFPFPPPGPSWCGFPGFAGTMRSSDSLPPIPPHFVSFAWRYHAALAVSLPDMSSALSRGLELVQPGLLPASRRGNDRASQVPGRPQCVRALLSDPNEVECPRQSGSLDVAFRNSNNVGLRHFDNYGAQSHGPHARCLRFAARVTPEPRKTRFRLVASHYRAGLATCWVALKVSAFYIGFPLLQALPGALEFCLPTGRRSGLQPEADDRPASPSLACRAYRAPCAPQRRSEPDDSRVGMEPVRREGTEDLPPAAARRAALAAH